MFSALVGIAIFYSSDPPFGIGSTHRDELRSQPYSEREWLTLMLSEYDEWSQELENLTVNNAAWLGRIQFSLVLGFF